MLKLSFLIICVLISSCLTYNQCPTCPYQSNPCGYNSPCGGVIGGYPTSLCSQGTCYNNYCQYLPCYYNTYRNYPYSSTNSGTTNKQNIYNYPFMQFTSNRNKFSNKPNNDPFANAELEIIDHNSPPPSQTTHQQQYPNYQQFYQNMMNFNQDPFANVPVEIIDEDRLEENGIDPKIVTTSHSSYSVNGGQQTVATHQKTEPISTTITRTFTPQDNVNYSETYVNGEKTSEESTIQSVIETSSVDVPTTEENDKPEAVNSWFKF